jgi:protein-S-isoprenylcysteine O-methyltransferase Ste14
MAAALGRFRRAGTPVETYRPTTALVTEGIYRRTRNPMYVALTLLYAGIGFAANSLWTLGFLPPLLLVMRYGVIAREERYLTRRFGTRYLDYQGSVRRWL